MQFVRYLLQTCDNALTSSAASQCLNLLSSMIGPNILRGRVEQFNPRYEFSFVYKTYCFRCTFFVEFIVIIYAHGLSIEGHEIY